MIHCNLKFVKKKRSQIWLFIFIIQTPNHSDLGLVYECSYRDVQPFNFRVQSPNGTGFSTFKKLLKDVSMS